MNRSVALLLAACCTGVLVGQAGSERQAPVGMRGRIAELVLPGSELVVAPTTHDAPIALRIAGVYPHGDRFRYDLEWAGLEPGTFDLARFLARKDGSPTADLPPIEVTVTSTLDPAVREPSPGESRELPRFSGYGTMQIAFAATWLVGLLAILLVGRKRRRRAAPPAAKPTLADRLRPFVEAAARGSASDGEKAELERLLLAFWRQRLGLVEAKADAALAAIRGHEEAGALLRQLEAWLHMPVPPQAVDVPALLAPYRDVAADAVASPQGAATR
jgi:hypothetical protein